MKTPEIPAISLAGYDDPQHPPQHVVDAIGDALSTVGFMTVVNHDVPDALIDAAYAASRSVFAHDDAALAQYARPDLGGQVGFITTGAENSKGADIPNLMRFWHIQHRLNPDWTNVWPEETPAFKQAMLALMDAFDEIAQKILAAIDVYLDQKVGTLWQLIRGGPSLLRPIHNPAPLPGYDSIGTSAHTDINVITILPAATAKGLMVQTKSGVWVPIPVVPGSLVVNTADMLEMITGKRITSRPHQVILPEGSGERFSIPYFVHFIKETVLYTYPDGTKFTAWHYLVRRLTEIGLWDYDLSEVPPEPTF